MSLANSHRNASPLYESMKWVIHSSTSPPLPWVMTPDTEEDTPRSTSSHSEREAEPAHQAREPVSKEVERDFHHHKALVLWAFAVPDECRRACFTAQWGSSEESLTELAANCQSSILRLVRPSGWEQAAN